MYFVMTETRLVVSTVVLYILNINVYHAIIAGSWSYIGTDATRLPLESFTMNLGFVDRTTVLHEFGHALGLIHGWL